MAVQMAESDKPVQIHAGEFELRLAETREEMLAAQRVRYQVFYDEMKAKPTPEMAAAQRDFDAYDEECDHLLVIDRRIGISIRSTSTTFRMSKRFRAKSSNSAAPVSLPIIAPARRCSFCGAASPTTCSITISG